jgi:parvulin-like peptidyl-prolyl isomerase
VSSDQGRRGKTGKGGGASGPAAARRLGLLVFGVAFVALFLIVALAVGIGNPSVPSGDVALVEDAPGDLGKVTKARFDHSLELAATSAGEKQAPKPGDPKYDEKKEAALNRLFETIWLQGLADEWGIEVSEEEIAAELEKIKKESFKTEAQFENFLKESHFTPADINEQVKLQILSKKLQERLKEKAPTPSQSEVENYYAAAKATQFTQKPTREVRVIINKDRKKAEEAFEALSKDDSAKNWIKVATKYSEDPATQKSGGLQKGVQEGVLKEPLSAAVFSTPEGQVEGPLKAQSGYAVFEVENSTPESVQELKAVESQIQSTLAQQLQQEYFTNFVTIFNTQWTQRTFCADGYSTERCANFKGNGHPQAAPEGCYEENPKGGFPEACPAPVYQLIPAMPGTVSPLEPKGKLLAQRPQPKEEPGKAAPEGAPGLSEGAAPPPAEEAPPAESE